MDGHDVFKLLLDAHAIVAERPVWDPNEDALVWVDIMGKKVVLTEESGEVRRSYSVNCHVGAAIPAVAGGWLLATSKGFSYLSKGGEVNEIVDVLSEKPGLRFNDMSCDMQGRAFAGTMRYDLCPGEGILYRLDGERESWRVQELVAGLGLSNGIGWSPNGRWMYLVDSIPKVVFRFEYDVGSGVLGQKEVFLACAGFEGMPDGLCVDAEGCVWIAFYGGGAVRSFAETGRMVRELVVPVSSPTCPGFGRNGLLYVTTAASPDDVSAGNGGLWVADVGVQGGETYCWRHGR